MTSITTIIREEIESLYQANFPAFGDRLRSISELFEKDPYPFRFDNVGYDEVNYHFDTPENEYIVVINNIDPSQGIWVMQFGVVDGTPEEVTNEFRVSEVMATLLKIVNDFINRYQPNAISIKPAKDSELEAERGKEDLRRFNIYMGFIKRNLKARPEYHVREYGDEIIIERKVKIDKPKTNV
jgi:hypothetical protein